MPNEKRVEVLANGATYRPREPIKVECTTHGWLEDPYIVVWRTHDVPTAERLALHAAAREWGPVTLPEPRQVWLKVVPWDHGSGSDSTIIETDPKRGTPCVEYRF